MRTIAVIPCHNEEKNIGAIVTEARLYVDSVVVIDNLSTDRTFDEAVHAGAICWKCPVKGAGVATRWGIERALNMGAECIVTLDGDGQHEAAEIPRLMAPVLSGAADVVIGSRFLNTANSIPKYRRFGIQVINLAYNFGREPITDCQSGFRAFSRKVAAHCPITENGFLFSTEFLIKAGKTRIVEVPIHCFYHKDFHMNSSLHPVKHGLSVLLGTVKLRIANRNVKALN